MDERIGFGLYQPCGDRGSGWDMCLCFGFGGVGGEWVGGLGPGSGAMGWCYVGVRCESGFSV